MVLLSDWPHQNCFVGETSTMGTECMCGSEMYFVGTGVLYSQTKIFLSSPVEMKPRSSSTNVTELQGCRWWLYTSVSSPERRSHWKILPDVASPAAASSTLSSRG